ncbi:hypothetical protein CRG98_005324 [Punica granatum]|uniref:Retrotransposon Copia-like N-terminal domain-containing protein n=1 Tax=Punica granatum TaxID=22663 RepID=A0A2I0L0L4_PUNGR|nr:hypothetical protein CRG98_005324 [Punica granatum]
MGYINNSCPCPPEVVTGQPNPEYTCWVRQDQLLLHAIIASMSEGVMPLIASAKTSSEAWNKLAKLYARCSRSRVMSLKDKLTRTTCDKLTDYEQFLKIAEVNHEPTLVCARYTNKSSLKNSSTKEGQGRNSWGLHSMKTTANRVTGGTIRVILRISVIAKTRTCCREMLSSQAYSGLRWCPCR